MLYLLLLLASTGQLNQITDSGGRVFTFHHDHERPLQRFQGHHPEILQEQLGFVRYQYAQNHWNYDSLGRCIRVKDPFGNVEVRSIDVLGRVTRVHEPDGNIRDLSYDGEGNVIRAKDKHYDVEFTYGGMNRLRARKQSGTTVRFHYDTEEQLTSIQNEAGSVYRFVLGPTGEVNEEHGFDGLCRKYSRDKAGRVQKVLRPGGIATEYAYDAVGRVLGVRHVDGNGNPLGGRAV